MKTTAKPKVSGYRLGKEIGRGGMSVVYSATNDKLKSSHAIKVFDVPECANRATLAAKFVAETRLLASLRHPNIVRVTDCGTASDGRPWCAMDLIEGKSLTVRMSQPATAATWSDDSTNLLPLRPLRACGGGLQFAGCTCNLHTIFRTTSLNS